MSPACSTHFKNMCVQVLRYSHGEKYGPHYDSVQGEALKVKMKTWPCEASVPPSALSMVSTDTILAAMCSQTSCSTLVFLSPPLAGPVSSHCDSHCVPQ